MPALHGAFGLASMAAQATHRRPLTQARRGVRGRSCRSVTGIIRRAALRRSRYRKDESDPPVVQQHSPDASTCEGAWASFNPRSRARTRVLMARARVDPRGSRENRGVPVADVLSARPRPTSGQRVRSERCACQVRQHGRNRYAGCRECRRRVDGDEWHFQPHSNDNQVARWQCQRRLTRNSRLRRLVPYGVGGAKIAERPRAASAAHYYPHPYGRRFSGDQAGLGAALNEQRVMR